MATFTDNDRVLLDTLKKAFENRTRTLGTKNPWQELLSHKGGLHEEIAGSWASQWSYGLGSTFSDGTFEFQDASVPPGVRFKSSKIGTRGVPEINFSPYSFRTNSSPSLKGHPISFEVVGPTLKSPATDWTWRINQGAGPHGGDLLTLSDRPDGNPATCVTIAEAYNLPSFVLGDVNEPNGGIFLVISDDGSNPGSIESGFLPMGAKDEFVDTARFEIFRVSYCSGSVLEIHPNKPFGTFFNLPPGVDRYIRGVTLFTPFVTRLVPIPGSGPEKGRETMFVFVSPEHSANSDLYPPFNGGTNFDGTWIQGRFTSKGAPGTSTAVGSPQAWCAKPTLPIPRPLSEHTALVESDVSFVSPTDVGLWVLRNTTLSVDDVGRVIHIVDVQSTRLKENAPSDFSQGNPSSCFGWYEILSVDAPDKVTVLRLPQCDPQTGITFYGPGPYIQVISGESATVSFTLHDSVSSFFESAFDIDKLESIRLKNIIDPLSVNRFQKSFSDTSPGFPKQASGFSSGRPDKAIFDTRTVDNGGVIPESYNPGNLMDLGFRVVFFPAKRGTGPVPDFDRPIVRNEVVIDPSISESQFLSVDYTAGTVTLSHPPPDSPGGDIIPNGIFTDSNNPRGEVILYAALVPSSMENFGETRITSQKFGDPRRVDVFSSPIEAFIDTSETNYDISAPYFGPSTLAPNPVEIVLDRLWDGPETGVIEILSGAREDSFSFGSWSYSSIRNVTASGKVVSALGGITSEPSVLDPSVSLSTSDERRVILRREVFFGRHSESLSKTLPSFREDVSYGSFAKSSVLHFEETKVQRNIDGSSSVYFQFPNQLWQPWGTWIPANIPTGGQSFLAADGIFSSPVYFENSLASLTGVGDLSPSPEGQKYDIEVLPVLGNNKGLSTDNIFIQGQQRFRLVTKFQTSGGVGGATDSIIFIGLISEDSSTIFTPAFASPIDPAKFYVGIRLEGDLDDPGDLWEFICQNPLSPSTTTIPFTLESNKVHYFIMETEEDGRTDPVSGEVPFRLKVQITNDSMNPLFSTTIPWGDPSLPFSATTFNFFMGIQYVSGASRRTLSPYLVSFVTRKDLPGPRIQ